jgi:hypothetical protein
MVLLMCDADQVLRLRKLLNETREDALWCEEVGEDEKAEELREEAERLEARLVALGVDPFATSAGGPVRQ